VIRALLAAREKPYPPEDPGNSPLVWRRLAFFKALATAKVCLDPDGTICLRVQPDRQADGLNLIRDM